MQSNYDNQITKDVCIICISRKSVTAYLDDYMLSNYPLKASPPGDVKSGICRDGIRR